MDKKYKLLALFNGAATDGEKQAALEGLKRLCAREGIKLDDFMTSEERKLYTLKTRTVEEIKLVSQIIFTLFPNGKKENKFKPMYKTMEGFLQFTATPREFMEIKYAFDVFIYYYRRDKKALSRKQKEAAAKLAKEQKTERENYYEAFLYANDLFPKSTETIEREELSAADLERLRKVWRQSGGMSRVRLNKPLAKGTVAETETFLLK